MTVTLYRGANLHNVTVVLTEPFTITRAALDGHIISSAD